MKFPVLHAEPDCSPARATRWRHGGCSLALLCSLARQKRYLAAVWLARFFAVWLGIWLQSGCFWLFLAPFLPFLPFWLAVWLRCFCSLALFCCSLAFFSEPDCKSGARLQNNGARLQVREPDCKKKEPDCKKKLQSGSLQSGYTTRVVGWRQGGNQIQILPRYLQIRIKYHQPLHPSG